MALTSPGVEVSVIDESFYTPAEPGTVPMVFVASAQNKTNASGTGTAQGTLAANAGVPYLLTSQRDLADTFGDPLFYTDNNNNPIHGGELNEYGLQAAYSLLGVSNRVYVTRADIDLGQLTASATVPSANPDDGTYWLDTANTSWGIQEWNGSARSASNTTGQTFTNKTPIVITETTDTALVQVNGAAETGPSSAVGEVGDYAILATTTTVKLFYRSAGNGNTAGGGTAVASGDWVLVGSDEWTASWPTITGSTVSRSGETGNITINGTPVAIGASDTLAEVATAINNLSLQGVNARAINSRLEIFSNGTSSGADDSTASGVIHLNGAEALLDDLGLPYGATDPEKLHYPPALAIAQHTSVPEWKTADTFSRPTGSIWVKTTEPNAGARWRVKQWNNSAQLWEDVSAPLYNDNVSALNGLDPTGGGSSLAVGDLYVQTNVAGDTLPLATFKIYRRSSAAPTNIVGTRIDADGVSAGSYEIVISATDAGSASYGTATSVAFTTAGAAADANTIASAINNAAIENVSASVDSQNRITISHSQGGDIKITDSLTPVLLKMGFAVGTTTNLRYQDGTDNTTDPLQVQATLWSVLTYTPSDNEVTDLAADDTLWYNSIVDEVDLLVHDGSTWVGFNNATDYASSEITVSASEPTSPSNNDIWISTADLENYPTIYRYNTALQQWDLLDKTDQTTENGVLFADARWTTEADNDQADASEIEDLLLDDFLDPDAPDPALYPRGMLLWNTRRSGFNVKKFVRNYIDLNADNERYNNGEAMSSYYPHRWVTESANQTDGSGSFGRIAQRKVVVQALQAMVNSNDAIRDNESRIFNLMACPGYPELIGEMISLNFDRGLTSFIVGDTPARLPSDATSLNNWATNQLLAVEDNDNGLVSRDEYLGIFYPHGFTSDNFGNNVVVPPSHMMLRTIALSDQVSFPWFAPAGTRRGGITNATATGFIDSEGEFVSIALNEGQRDTLYSNDVNPITFITGAGLVNYGQKTRSRGSSALDRINVARLVIFLRSQLNQLAKPYIFEPNDKITRDEIKQAAESLMLELVGQRALYDFLVVCDESNNTPSRIDRNELYLDIAIEPVKAVEFIYIPLRLKNTGEIAGL